MPKTIQDHITRDERELIALYRQLNADGRAALLQSAADFTEIQRYTAAPGEIIQFGRRNLSAYDRGVLALKLKPVIAEQVKKKEAERKTTYQKSEKSPMPTRDTAKELATTCGNSYKRGENQCTTI